MKTPNLPKMRLSKKRLLYISLKKAYIKTHPICELCKINKSEQIHHRAGRLGDLLTKEKFFLAVCDKCHKRIHLNEEESREKGLIIYFEFHPWPSWEEMQKDWPYSNFNDSKPENK